MAYTDQDIDEYLTRISFPSHKYPKPVKGLMSTQEGLEFLARLQKYQLVAVPYENLSLHYAKFPAVSLDKNDLFEKIVRQRRGGYCMELNLFFSTILQSLGYEVIHTGARVYNPSIGEFGGWNHQVNLVHIENILYLIDVGYGEQGPTRPLALYHGQVAKWGSTVAETRLTYHVPSIPCLNGLWHYEFRKSEEVSWTSLFCFGLTEFSPHDFEVMNFATSTKRTSLFTRTVLCNRMLLDREQNDFVGTLSLIDGALKQRIGGYTYETKCTTEEERVRVLKEKFGIVLTKGEQEGIKGTYMEIKPVP